MTPEMKPPIYFYLARQFWPEANNAIPPDWPGYLYAHGAWVVRTFDELRKRGFECQLVSSPPSDGIVITYYNCFDNRLMFWRSWAFPSRNRFVVCVRGDRGRRAWAQAHISQNPCQTKLENEAFTAGVLARGRTHFMPHWPIKDLIPRSPSRGDTIKNIVFYGTKTQLAQELIDEDWGRYVESLGMNWSVNSDISRCNDYSQTDIVIAIRDFTGAPHFRKPAWKIVNGWHANALVIASPESSTECIRKSPYDFIEVKSYDDLKTVLADIKQGRIDYSKYVQQGAVTGAEYSDAVIAAKWTNLIEDQLVPAYAEWRTLDNTSFFIYLLLRFIDGALNGLIGVKTRGFNHEVQHG